MTKAKDAHAQQREALKRQHEELKAAHDEAYKRAEAMLSVPQKVVDGNETAALATITGWKPLRDESDAPEPAVLGAPAAGEEDSLGTKADEVPQAKAEPKTSAKVS